MTNLVTHVWRPSHSRTIVLNGFSPVPRGTAAADPALQSWPSKDPADVLDYILNIEPALAGNEGDGVEGIDVTVYPSETGDLAVDNVTADGNKIIFWLSSGQASTTYTLTVRIALSSGRIIQRSLALPVMALSSTPSTANTLVSSMQAPLTDQFGNPIVIA